MPEEEQDDNIQEDPSLLEDDELEDSSTSEDDVEQEEEKQPPFHEHPRWKERDEELRRERQRSDELQRQLLELTRPKQEVRQEEQLGETPEAREFWSQVKKLAKQEAETARKQAQEVYEAELKAIRQEYGKMAANSFLKEHPDLKPGSPELNQIVHKAQTHNLDLNDAYKLIMFDKKESDRAVAKVNKKKQIAKEKLAANVETKSVPQSSFANNKNSDIEADFDKAWKDLGLS